MVIIQVTERGKPSEWQGGSTRQATLPRGLTPKHGDCLPLLWVGAIGKERAYVDNHLHFIKNNWRSLQTFLANMQLSGMDGKGAFFLQL